MNKKPIKLTWTDTYNGTTLMPEEVNKRIQRRLRQIKAYSKLLRYTKALRARLFMMQLEDTIGHPDWDAVNQEELEAFCDLEPWQRDGLK